MILTHDVNQHDVSHDSSSGIESGEAAPSAQRHHHAQLKHGRCLNRVSLVVGCIMVLLARVAIDYSRENVLSNGENICN